MKKNVIHKGLVFVAVSLFASTLTLSSAQAALIGVAGPLSTAGTAAAIVGAPASALDATVTNTGQEGFDEMQGVVLGVGIAHDAGVIAAGTRVDSHMIFLNKPTGGASTIFHTGVTWTFSGTILGVMSDSGGLLESASTAVLGAAGTAYPAGFTARGMEGADGYAIAGAMLTVAMGVSQPGDWIRVVTLSAIPLPAALPLYGAGMAVLGLLGWRRKHSKKVA